MLTSASAPFNEIHLFLASAGRWVLAVAATFFLAYVVLMATMVLVSAVRGWVRAVGQQSRRPLGAGGQPRREAAGHGMSTAHLAKQS